MVYPPNLLALAEALAAAGSEAEARVAERHARSLAMSGAADPDAAEWEARANEVLAGDR